jgi:hypothetical protein
VPLGLTGLQQIVIDLELGPVGTDSVPALLRGYGKEGLLSRHPTLRITDEAWSAIMADSR